MNALVDYIYENVHELGFCVHDIPSSTMVEILKIAYNEGYADGLTAFAWWEDGVQYVGTCGTTLKQALEEVL